jgi:hypothetical protein
VKCEDCGKVHNEIFDLPGTRAEVIKAFKRMIKEIDEILTGLF